MKARIAPSILSADFANLESELKTIENADMIHVDIMDGHFVPNMTFGLPVLKRISQVTTVPLDVHLMIENPEKWAVNYAEFAYSLTFHYESTDNPSSVIELIRSTGKRVSMAVKPGTPFSATTGLLHELDMLLVMTVEPGFGGQGLIPQTLEKVREAFSFRNSNGLSYEIQVDGGVTTENIQELSAAGADTFVAGTAVFSAIDRHSSIEKLRLLASTV